MKIGKLIRPFYKVFARPLSRRLHQNRADLGVGRPDRGDLQSYYLIMQVATDAVGAKDLALIHFVPIAVIAARLSQLQFQE